MSEAETMAKEIATDHGHKDVDHLIVCTDGTKVPVWKFYLPAAEIILTAVSLQSRGQV